MSHKFINEAYTGLDASGGTEDTSYDMESMFWNQIKQIQFRLGNTGASAADYELSASGVNSGIMSEVEFSEDKISWDSTVTLAGIAPNGISDIIYCRMTMPEDAYISSGTFLIHVEES